MYKRQVIDNTSEWYRVAYNGAIGYVSADYIQYSEDGDVDLGTGIVNEDSVNILSLIHIWIVDWKSGH